MTKKKTTDDNLKGADRDEEEARRVMAHTIARPSVNAAVVIKEYHPNVERLEINALVNELAMQCQAVNDGDLKRAEAMLIAQAHALQAIFTNLSARAIKAEYLNQVQAYLSLALKAQSQCRTTLQALGELKYPKETAFIRQQNVAVNQQVNNANAVNDPQARACTRVKFSNSTNELLENSYERVDLETQDPTGAAHSTLETVGAVERAENGKR